MKIKRVEVWKQTMQLSESYTIAYGTYTEASCIFIRIETDNNLSGFGCASPDYHVTGETSDSVADILKNVVMPFLFKKDPLRYIHITENIKKMMPESRAARAAVDMALYDILGKYSELPVWKLLGGYRTKIATSRTIGIMPLAETLEIAARYLREGVRILKLKGGLSMNEDLEKLHKMRERFGKTVKIRFDANQGYSVEDAIRFTHEQNASIHLELLEQPTPANETKLLGKITSRSSIPVMADESILGLTDAFHLVRHDLIDMINIKLMKTGGITDALHINSIGRAAGVEVMVGCMDESALGIAAGLHFALSRPNIQYADLDGHFGLIDDPAAGILVFKNGYLYPADKSGFGWTGP